MFNISCVSIMIIVFLVLCLRITSLLHGYDDISSIITYVELMAWFTVWDEHKDFFSHMIIQIIHLLKDHSVSPTCRAAPRDESILSLCIGLFVRPELLPHHFNNCRFYLLLLTTGRINFPSSCSLTLSSLLWEFCITYLL